MPSRTFTYQFGPYQFVPDQQELRHGDSRGPLTKSMNRLLLLLVSHPGELITREQIANELWSEHGTVDITSGINTAINRLRTRLGDNNGDSTFIETVVGSGYRFTATVELIPDLVPYVSESNPILDSSTEEPPALHAPSKMAFRFPLVSLCLGALVLAAAGAAWKKTPRPHTLTATPVSSTEIYTPHMFAITREDPEDQLGQQTISPSGKYVAYSDRHGLFVRTLADNTQKQVAIPKDSVVTRISWFPDETSLLISGNESTPTASSSSNAAGALWEIPIDGGSATKRLEAGLGGTISPDGNQIAFLRAGQTELWIAKVAGTSSHKLAQTAHGDIFSTPIWSPAGDRLVVDRIEAALMNLPSGDPTVTESRSTVEQPIEDKGIYESYRASDGKLLAQQDGIRFNSAVLLPNGIVYYVVPSETSDAKVAIVQTNIATGAFTEVPSPLTASQAFSAEFASAEQLTASKDGKVLSAVLDRKATHIFVADLLRDKDHSPYLEHERLWSRHTFTTLPTAWSRDGKMVISDEGFHGVINIVGQTFDGAKTQMFAAGDPDNGFAQAHYSADGKWLMYLHLHNSLVQAIERVPAQGGTAQIVPNTQGVAEFRCSALAVGRCVVRKIEDKRSIAFYELDPVLGMGKLILRMPWRETALGDWAISPDGKTFAMADHNPAHPSVQIIPLSGAALHSIPINGYGTVLGVSWAINGHDLFIHTLASSKYSALYVDSNGKTTLLHQSPEIIWSVQSPDGKTVAFPFSTPSNRNLWAGSTHLGLN